jgi:hypothetical protein
MMGKKNNRVIRGAIAPLNDGEAEDRTLELVKNSREQ